MFNKIIRVLNKELSQLYFAIIQSYPDSYLGRKLRKNYWKKKLRNCGNNPEFRKGSGIGFPELIDFGNDSIIGHDSIVTAGHSYGIYIGNNVSISRSTFIHASNHNIDDLDKPIMDQGTSCASINYKDKVYSVVIEDGVWIGSKSVLLSGTHLKKGCVVSAGSVISGQFQEYSVIAGNPGRVIKQRKWNENLLVKNLR